MESREPVVLVNKGKRLFGMFHQPEVSGKRPAVMICHGLGGNKIGRYRMYVRLAQKLSEKGIATLRLDFRGSGDSEGEFSEMTLMTQLEDALAGLRYLRTIPLIDIQSIGLMGCSFGGAVAAMAAQEDEAIKSLALWAPVYSGDQWQAKWKQLHEKETSNEKKVELMRIEGQIAGYPFLQQLFSMQMQQVLANLHHIPLLHIHGTRDEVVDISQADLFKKARNAAIAQSKFMRLPNSDHDFGDPDELETSLDVTAKWFDETLRI